MTFNNTSLRKKDLETNEEFHGDFLFLCALGNVTPVWFRGAGQDPDWVWPDLGDVLWAAVSVDWALCRCDGATTETGELFP